MAADRALKAAVLASTLLLAFATPPSSARQAPSASPPYVLKDHYEKKEVMIPMRDGVHLFTVLYMPRDRSKTYPFLMTRTATASRPTARTTTGAGRGPHADFSKEGYIFVYQDVRGRFKSEGEFVHHAPYVARAPSDPNESTDTYDTDRLAARRTSPTTTAASDSAGISWPGWQRRWGMIDAHPALKRRPRRRRRRRTSSSATTTTPAAPFS